MQWWQCDLNRTGGAQNARYGGPQTKYHWSPQWQETSSLQMFIIITFPTYINWLVFAVERLALTSALCSLNPTSLSGDLQILVYCPRSLHTNQEIVPCIGLWSIVPTFVEIYMYPSPIISFEDMNSRVIDRFIKQATKNRLIHMQVHKLYITCTDSTFASGLIDCMEKE